MNIVQESEVWSTAMDSINFQHAVIFMTSYMDGFLCISEDDIENIQLQLAIDPPSLVQPSHARSTGRNVIPPCESSSNSVLQDDSLQISTDPSEHMEQEAGVHVPPPVVG